MSTTATTTTMSMGQTSWLRRKLRQRAGPHPVPGTAFPAASPHPSSHSPVSGGSPRPGGTVAGRRRRSCFQGPRPPRSFNGKHAYRQRSALPARDPASPKAAFARTAAASYFHLSAASVSMSVRGSLTGHHPADLACTSHQRERRLNRPVR